MTIDPILPISWIIVLAVVLTALTLAAQLRSGRTLGRKRNFFLATVRLLGVLAVVALLLRFSKEEKIVPPSVERSFLIAIDSSASMAEDDVDGVTRFEYARNLIREAGLLEENLASSIKLHTFASRSREMTPELLQNLTPNGEETLMHSSLRHLFRSVQGAPPSALLLLSDGHDQEGISPGQTAKLARNRECVIHGMPIGSSGTVRDVSVQIATYHPYTFKEQLTRLSANIRTIGCARETLIVELLREGKLVDSKRIQTGNESFHDIEFVVSEENPGQFEYAFRVQAVSHEAELRNNTAVSYLNVLDEKIRVLLIEGAPYWDTTFLRRSLARNDKLDIDALVRFTPDRVRAVRSNPKRSNSDLTAPQTLEEFKAYKLVILGKKVHEVLGENGIRALQEWADQTGGIVVFARGRAWSDLPEMGLEPIEWSEKSEPARLEISAAARSVAPFKLLSQRLVTDELPEIVSFQASGKPKQLAESYAQVGGQDSGVVYRRFGRGQTLSFGVGDLWKWVFNGEAEFDNNLYDLFWDQLVLWLLSNGGLSPSSDYSFQTNTANLALGEKITFTLSLNGKEAPQSAPTVVINHQNEEAAVLALAPDDEGASYEASFTPRIDGRYSAHVTLPNGKKAKARFITYVDQVERTETAADPEYLKQLSVASGGRLVKPNELKNLFDDFLRETSPLKERTKLVPLWDQVWVLLAITFLFALEWFCRRRWGLT